CMLFSTKDIGLGLPGGMASHISLPWRAGGRGCSHDGPHGVPWRPERAVPVYRLLRFFTLEWVVPRPGTGSPSHLAGSRRGALLFESTPARTQVAERRRVVRRSFVPGSGYVVHSHHPRTSAQPGAGPDQLRSARQRAGKAPLSHRELTPGG